MKAEDSVMNDTELMIWHLKPLESRRAIAQAQADISFKVGKQEGIKEVVEFIEKRRNACRLNTEQFECRLCLSELLKALSNSRSGV